MTSANNSIFDSSSGIEVSTTIPVPIFDSTGGIFSIGGPPPADTQITWGDGTNVTSGDATNTTWSA